MDEDPCVSGFSCWNFNIHNDDQMWGHALAIDQMIELLFWGQDLTVDEEILMNLLQMAVIDRREFDKPMDVATRVMQHSVALAARLWVMFEEQKRRVYLQGILILTKTTNNIHRVTVWSARLVPEMRG